MRIIFYFTILGFFLLQNGCVSGSGALQPVSIKRPPSAQAEEVKIVVSRRDLRNVLREDGEVPQLRMVEVYIPSPDAYPEWRIFDITPDSAYYLLGLRNADVLLSANDRAVRSPLVFPKFVSLLPVEQEATVEVRRGKKVIRFLYVMTE